MSRITIRIGVPVELDERLLAGPHPDHGPAVAGEVAADELADRRLVLHQKNVTGHETSLGRGHRPPRASAGGIRTWTRAAAPPSTVTVVAISRRRTWSIVAGRPAIFTRVFESTAIVTMLPSGSRRVSEVELTASHATVVVREGVRNAPDDDIDRCMRPAGREVRRRRQPDRPGAACEDANGEHGCDKGEKCAHAQMIA